MAAYVRCLKKKNERNEIVWFYCTQSAFFFVELQGSVGEIRTNEEHFSVKNEKKLRATSLKQNLPVLL